MKLFKGLSVGALIGLLVAGIISVFAFFWPLLSCTCDIINCFIQCDTDYLYKSCDSEVSKEREEVQENFDYASTFIYSTIIGASIGGLWGAAKTTKAASQAAKARKEQIAKETNERHIANQKETAKALEIFVRNTEKSYNESYRQFSDIRYHYYDKKNSIETSMNNCKRKKQQTETIMNNQISDKN